MQEMCMMAQNDYYYIRSKYTSQKYVGIATVIVLVLFIFLLESLTITSVYGQISVNPSLNLNVPQDKFVEASSVAGTTVVYSAMAFDATGHILATICSPPSGSLFPLGTTTVNCSATDGSGNNITKSFKVTVKDTTPPNLTLSISNLIIRAQGRMNPVSYSGYVSALDKVYGTVSPICSPPSGSLFPLGTTTVNCSATDGSGNNITKSFKVTVRYPIFGGFLSPINEDGSSVFKLGDIIPVKFQLKWLDGKFVIDALVQIYIAKISNNITGTEMEMVSSSDNDHHTTIASKGNFFSYDYAGNQYIYNLQTNGLTTGTWQIKILLDDGTSPSVIISIQK